MLTVKYHTVFKREYKKMCRRGLDMNKLHEAVAMLANEKPLPANYKDHDLSGNYAGFRECHIQSDWLLIYRIDKKELTLILSRTGTHSDLFDK